jgi:hypothetical protein
VHFECGGRGGWWGLRSVPLLGSVSLAGRCPWRVVRVEIGVLGWVVRADVVGGEREARWRLAGRCMVAPRCARSWVSNRSPPWSLRVGRPTRGED